MVGDRQSIKIKDSSDTDTPVEESNMMKEGAVNSTKSLETDEAKEYGIEEMDENETTVRSHLGDELEATYSIVYNYLFKGHKLEYETKIQNEPASTRLQEKEVARLEAAEEIDCSKLRADEEAKCSQQDEEIKIVYT